MLNFAERYLTSKLDALLCNISAFSMRKHKLVHKCSSSSRSDNLMASNRVVPCSHVHPSCLRSSNPTHDHPRV